MKKLLVGATIALLAFAGAAPTAQAAEGNGQAYGAVVQQCLGVSVGDAIAAGKVAHPGIKMTAKTIAESPHCA
ncbi:MAG: hypothetical protein HY829_01185 [Actinobacteria bacterium]|nr:hypothetical protein [Actinomycetota bacterium]